MSQNPSGYDPLNPQHNDPQAAPQQPFGSQPHDQYGYQQGYGTEQYGSQQGYGSQQAYPADQTQAYGSQQAQGYDPATGANSGYGTATAYDQYGGGQYGAPAPRQPSFFSSLFDLKFRSFITIRFAAVIYVIGIVLIALNYIGAVISSIIVAGASMATAAYTSSGVGGVGVFLVIMTVIVGAVMTIFWIMLLRVIIEFFVANIRTAESTSETAANTAR